MADYGKAALSQVNVLSNATGNRLTTAFDAFQQPDGKASVSDSGQTYLVAGDNDNCLFRIKNKKAVLGDLGNAYLSLDAGGTIETMGAEWVWENGTTLSTVAVVITNDTDLALGNLLHFITNTQTWNLQIRKGGKSNTLNTYMTGNYKTPLTKDGVTKYRFEMTVIKETNTVYMRLPDGDVVTFTHPDVSLVTGSRGYWQIIRRNATDEEPKFTSFWLTKKDDTKHYHSGKGNLDIYPAVAKLKELGNDKYLNKHVFSFTPTTTGWHRIYSGVLDTLSGTVNVYTKDRYDNTVTDVEFDFSITPFSGAKGLVLQQRRYASLASGVVNQVRISADNNNLYVDINVTSATTPQPIYIEGKGFKLLQALSRTDQAIAVNPPVLNPTVPATTKSLALGNGNELTVDNTVGKNIVSFTPTAVGWYRILSGVFDYLGGKLNIYTDGKYDNTVTDVEVDIAISAFSSSGFSMQQKRFSTFLNGVVNQIRCGSDGSNNLYVDIYVNSATAPQPIYVEYSGYKFLQAIKTQPAVIQNPPVLNPATPSKSQTLTLGNGFRTNRVVSMGSTEKLVEIVTATGNVNTTLSVTAIDATSGNVTLTLPNSTTLNNHEHTFTRVDGSANTTSIIGNFSDGTTTKTLSRGVPFKVIADLTSDRWFIV